jgi:DNA-binding transcriptional ArsR family regulator
LKKSVEVVADPEKAKVLVDPMRRELVRLLAEHPMTENELAILLGLSNPSVGHHLKILARSGFVRIARKEAEEHGILQKFYEANALVYLINGQKMPLEIERYFMPISLERARGITVALSFATQESVDLSPKELEEFAKILNSTIMYVSSSHARRWNRNREEVINAIYRDALTYLLKKPDLLSDKVRNLLIKAHK